MIKNKTVMGTLKVGSYNIKTGVMVKYNMPLIANDITSLGLDIVGFQEIDQFTTRSGGIDTVKLLCEATGYKYGMFSRAIDYKGGQYGTAILSRYPIKSFEVIQLDAASFEGRSAGHAVIDVNGVSVDFFNTHLSYESTVLRSGQFNQLAGLLKKCGTFILTGDFNTEVTSEFSVIESSSIVNNNTYPTFPSTGKGIDNIILSEDWSVVSSGMGPAGHSDHNLLWAEIKYIK
jgi:endonuclease/exonuclease/phosphatase family metal-dependent hydrolase